ncbi:MAG TPA: tetratricopeptide repeat protein [Myxococcota bacterium]|nr:tetratricopeptide repeat protein [Myxococcota bacterium]
MGLIRRRVEYDRKRLLAAAEHARARGQHRRAIALYRRVLAAEPHDAAVHARIAPLLAARGERFDAWRSYQQAAQAHLRNQARGEAIAIYRDATRALPTQIEAWRAVAKLELARDAREAALGALLEGRSKFRSRRQRPEAIALLREAREIDAWRLDIVLDLARLLRRSGQATEAQWILGQLADRIRGRELRIVRGAQWRIEPSLRHSWSWLRAAFAGSDARRDLAPPLRRRRAHSRLA